MVSVRYKKRIHEITQSLVRIMKLKIGRKLHVWHVVLAGLIVLMLLLNLQPGGKSTARELKPKSKTSRTVRQKDEFDDFDRAFDDFDRFDPLFDDEPVHVMPD